MKVVSFLFLFFIVGVCYSAPPASDCISIIAGDFNDPTTWDCGEVPNKACNVTINHAVVLNVSFTGGSKISGDWNVAAGASLVGTGFNLTFGSGTSVINGTFNIGDLRVENGADVTFGATANVTINGDFNNDNNSNEVVVNTSNFDVLGALVNGNGSSITGIGCLAVTGTITNDDKGILFDCGDGASGGVGCDACAPVLAVELLNFSGRNIEGITSLTWITASETDNKEFIIDKSTDGKSFYELVRINGAGRSFSAISYAFEDPKENEGTTYYRIKDVDYSSLVTSRGIITVESEKSADLITYNPTAINNKTNTELFYLVTSSSGIEVTRGFVPVGGVIPVLLKNGTGQLVCLTIYNSNYKVIQCEKIIL